MNVVPLRFRSCNERVKAAAVEATYDHCIVGCRRLRHRRSLEGSPAEWGSAASFEWVPAERPQPQAEYVSVYFLSQLSFTACCSLQVHDYTYLGVC